MSYLNFIHILSVFKSYLRDYESDWLDSPSHQPHHDTQLVYYGELRLVKIYAPSMEHNTTNAVYSGSHAMVSYYFENLRFGQIGEFCTIVGRTGYVDLLSLPKAKPFETNIEHGFCQLRYSFNYQHVDRVAEVILGKRFITEWNSTLLEFSLSTLRIFHKHLGPYGPSTINHIWSYHEPTDDIISFIYLDETGIRANPTIASLQTILGDMSLSNNLVERLAQKYQAYDPTFIIVRHKEHVEEVQARKDLLHRYGFMEAI